MSSVPSILLVGSESAARSSVAEQLRECGFRVVYADGLHEAMALLGSREVAVDLVFSDTHLLDERDGFGLARWVRAACPGLAVVVTSGSAQTADLCDQLRGFGPVEAELCRTVSPAAGTGATSARPERIRGSATVHIPTA